MGDLLNVDMNYLIGKKESTEIIPDSYYLNPEARDMAQFLFENPEYKVLFDASRKVKPEDIQFVKEMIEIGAHKRNGNHYESVCRPDPGYYGIRETLMLLHRCNFSKI